MDDDNGDAAEAIERAEMEQDDLRDTIADLGAALDAACVELEQLLRSPYVAGEARETAAIALADGEACLLRCGVRTTKTTNSP